MHQEHILFIVSILWINRNVEFLWRNVLFNLKCSLYFCFNCIAICYRMCNIWSHFFERNIHNHVFIISEHARVDKIVPNSISIKCQNYRIPYVHEGSGIRRWQPSMLLTIILLPNIVLPMFVNCFMYLHSNLTRKQIDCLFVTSQIRFYLESLVTSSITFPW